MAASALHAFSGGETLPDTYDNFLKHLEPCLAREEEIDEDLLDELLPG